MGYGLGSGFRAWVGDRDRVLGQAKESGFGMVVGSGYGMGVGFGFKMG